jgi:pimeloyl-ACP methyl ester carboxylesterase
MNRAVRIDLPGAVLSGDLTLPVGTTGLVIFAHGSGSSRHSPRNRFVAQRINAQGLGTLLVDLLTAEEEETDEVTHEIRFDIGLLARRVAQVVAWAGRQEQTAPLLIGLFGASTGAAAALVAAAELPAGAVRTVVSRGGRPDLAQEALARVRCPVLLIVGSHDDVVLDLNEQARALMKCETELVIVPGATHLFEEEGALEEVADLAAVWLGERLGKVA